MSNTPKRLTSKMKQEKLSRTQFSERLLEYDGWLTDEPYDLGEDFFVRIYEDGLSSGLLFMVQLKSTSDIDKLRVADRSISYSFEVKDLKHWSVSATPVFLIVWDVVKKIGHWINVWKAIAWLNAHHPNWQAKRGSVKVWIPDANTTNDTGLKEIRDYLGKYFYESLSKEQQLEINFVFSFPETSEGEAAREALIRFRETGDTVQIDEKFIQSFRFSDWYTRTQGKKDIAQVILSSTPGTPVPTRMDVITDEGQIFSLPYIELRAVKYGQNNRQHPIDTNQLQFISH